MYKKKPITPSLRGTILLKNKDLIKKVKVKNLISGFFRSRGRNNQGRITVRHRGGGHKRLYRLISFKRKSNIKGTVKNLEYDPNRSANIALIENNDDSYEYIIAPKNLKIGDQVSSEKNADIQIGNSLPLGEIPLGTYIHNISLVPHGGGKFIRSAGTFGQIIQKNEKLVKVRLQSNEQRLFNINCYATIGIVSNSDHKNIKLGKAGRSRWLNRRPHVRGVAMNPVDHPHGGGEGKTSGGRVSVTPSGRITKGKPTRKKINKLRIL